jgi:hypothetical protein
MFASIKNNNTGTISFKNEETPYPADLKGKIIKIVPLKDL